MGIDTLCGLGTNHMMIRPFIDEGQPLPHRFVASCLLRYRPIRFRCPRTPGSERKSVVDSARERYFDLNEATIRPSSFDSIVAGIMSSVSAGQNRRIANAAFAPRLSDCRCLMRRARSWAKSMLAVLMRERQRASRPAFQHVITVWCATVRGGKVLLSQMESTSGQLFTPQAQQAAEKDGEDSARRDREGRAKATSRQYLACG